MVTSGLTIETIYQNYKGASFTTATYWNCNFPVNKNVSGYKMLVFTISLQYNYNTTPPNYYTIQNCMTVPVMSDGTYGTIYSSTISGGTNYAAVSPNLTGTTIGTVYGGINNSSSYGTSYMACVLGIYGLK